MLLDAKKAHLHAMAERPIFVQLPPERARPGYCCRLIRSLYGPLLKSRALSFWKAVSSLMVWTFYEGV